MKNFAQYVHEKKGIRLRMVLKHRDTEDFDAFLEHVEKSRGGVFGLGDITITKERKKIFKFSPPFFYNAVLLVSHKNLSDLKYLQNINKKFKDKTAFVVKGAINEKRTITIKRKFYPEMHIEYSASSEEALNSLIKNKNGFTLMDFSFYLDAVKRGLPIKRHHTNYEPRENFGIIMPLNSDWHPVFEEFMNSGFLKSVAYRKMIAKHMGINVLRFLDSLEKDN